ncbi:hypothetical protein ACIKTA_17015, partial [Hansschlegelia beijingensis]
MWRIGTASDIRCLLWSLRRWRQAPAQARGRSWRRDCFPGRRRRPDSGGRKLAVGYTLDEIDNDITGGATPASFEPTIDYVVTKIPRFAF